LTHISDGFLRETPSKCPWLPSIAFTSENLGFWQGLSGFLNGWVEFCFEGDFVPKFFKNIFRKFLAHPEKYFPDFSYRKIFTGLFLQEGDPFSFGDDCCITLSNCAPRQIKLSTPAGSRVLRLSQIRRHVEKRINLIAAKMSGNLGDAKTMVFKLCDGTARHTGVCGGTGLSRYSGE